VSWYARAPHSRQPTAWRASANQVTQGSPQLASLVTRGHTNSSLGPRSAATVPWATPRPSPQLRLLCVSWYARAPHSARPTAWRASANQVTRGSPQLASLATKGHTKSSLGPRSAATVPFTTSRPSPQLRLLCALSGVQPRHTRTFLNARCVCRILILSRAALLSMTAHAMLDLRDLRADHVVVRAPRSTLH